MFPETQESREHTTGQETNNGDQIKTTQNFNATPQDSESILNPMDQLYYMLMQRGELQSQEFETLNILAEDQNNESIQTKLWQLIWGCVTKITAIITERIESQYKLSDFINRLLNETPLEMLFELKSDMERRIQKFADDKHRGITCQNRQLTEEDMQFFSVATQLVNLTWQLFQEEELKFNQNQ